LQAHGKVERGWLGVSMQRMDATMAQAMAVPGDVKGVLVNGVEPDSPAAKAELKAGDIVTAANGKAVRQPRDLAEAVGAQKPGAALTLSLLRDGKAVDAKVTLGAPREQQAAAEAPQQGKLGLALAPREGGKGAVVAEVRPDSPAAEHGMQPGDVILKAGDRAVTSPKDVIEAVGKAREAKRPAIALQVERDGSRVFVALPLA
jgi:serine protease Do